MRMNASDQSAWQALSGKCRMHTKPLRLCIIDQDVPSTVFKHGFAIESSRAGPFSSAGARKESGMIKSDLLKTLIDSNHQGPLEIGEEWLALVSQYVLQSLRSSEFKSRKWLEGAVWKTFFRGAVLSSGSNRRIARSRWSQPSEYCDLALVVGFIICSSRKKNTSPSHSRWWPGSETFGNIFILYVRSFLFSSTLTAVDIQPSSLPQSLFSPLERTPVQNFLPFVTLTPPPPCINQCALFFCSSSLETPATRDSSPVEESTNINNTSDTIQ